MAKKLGTRSAVPDLRLSEGQTHLVSDNQCQNYNYLASLHQPCRSHVDSLTASFKAPAYSGYTTVFRLMVEDQMMILHGLRLSKYIY